MRSRTGPAVRFRNAIFLFAAVLGGFGVVPDASAQTARIHHTSTLLSDGDVLICGGESTADSTNAGRFLNTCELYLSTAGAYTSTFQFGSGVARSSQTATLLPDGTVLFVGGNNNSGFLALAEIYNPFTQQWVTNLSAGFAAVAPNGLADQTATLLTAGTNGGKVLIAGGRNSSGTTNASILYTPTGVGAGTWSAGPNLNVDRAFHTATPLYNGQVLFSGGFSSTFGFLQSTEIYDSLTSLSFVAGQNMSIARAYHIATPLGNANHQILIAGGLNGVDDPTRFNRGFIKFTDIYDPTTNSMTAGPSLQMNVMSPVAAQPPDGTIRVLGGIGNVDFTYLTNQNENLNANPQSVDFPDFTTGPVPRAANVTGGTLQYTVPSGGITVAAAGVNGVIMSGVIDVSSATIIVSSGSFVFTSQSAGSDPNTINCATPGAYCPGLRASLSGITITNGIIPAGTNLALSVSSGMVFASTFPFINSGNGTNTLQFTLPGTSFNIATATVTINNMVFSTNNIYNPASNTWTLGLGLKGPRRNSASTLLPNGDILIDGGNDNNLPALSSTIGYILNGISWSPAANMNQARANHTMTLLPNGKLIAVGGGIGTSVFDSTELYDPNADSWSFTGPMISSRAHHTATLLANGRLLVVGGEIDTTGTPTATCEIYDPTLGQWFQTGSLNTARKDHTASLLPDGNVLVVGGINGPWLSSAEIYYSTAGVWSPITSIPAAGGLSQQAATRLQNGNVLIAGGTNATGALKGVYLFNSSNYTWSTMTNLNTARFALSADTLPNGQVEVMGGNNGVSGPTTQSETFTANGNTRTNGLVCGVPVSIPGGCWDNSGNSTYPSWDHASVQTPDGKIYKIGGQALPQFVSGSEQFDISFSTIAFQGQMSTGRVFHAATLLKDGRVLAAGGQSAATTYLASAESSYYNYSPDSRRPTISSMAPTTTLPGTTITVLGNQFTGQRDPVSATQGMSDSDNLPRLTLQTIETGGSGPQQSGGFLLDLSTEIYNGVNPFSTIDSSITVALPITIGANPLSPGWYHVRVQSAGEASKSELLQVGPVIPTGTPGSITGTAIGTSSISWNWGLGTLTAGSFNAYEVHYTSAGIFEVAISTAGPGPAFQSTFTEVGLAPNTQGAIQVGGFDLSGVGPLRASGAVFTLAAPPLNLVVSTVTNSSANLSWFTNSNSTNTVYEVSMSTDDFVTNFSTPIPSSLNLLVSTATIGSLVNNTTYFFRIRAFNGSGIPTAFSNIVSTLTPTGITGLTGTALSNSSIQWSWNPATGASSYAVFNSTSGQQIGSVPSSQTQFVETGLGVNTSAVVQIAAISGAGEGPLSASATTFTWANLPSVPNPDVVSVTNSGFTTLWGNNGNPPGTIYHLRIANSSGTFVVALTTTALSNLLTGQTPNSLYTISITGIDGGGICNGGGSAVDNFTANCNYQAFGSTYTAANAPINLAVNSVGTSNIKITWGANSNPGNTDYQIVYSTDNFVNSISTFVPFSANFTGLTKNITGLASGTTYQVEVMAANQNGLVTAPIAVSTVTLTGGGPPGSCFFVVDIAGGNFSCTLASGRTLGMHILPLAFGNGAPVSITISSQTAFVGCQNPPGLDAAFTVSVNPPTQPEKTITMELSLFPPEPGVTNMNQLAMVRVDPSACVPLYSTATNSLVVAQTNHLSTFQLAQVAGASDLSSPRIYPNPFDSSRVGYVTIDHVPAGAHIRIYTLKGEKVHDGTADGSGVMIYKGHNISDRSVASGIYLVVIESGGNRTILKLAVYR